MYYYFSKHQFFVLTQLFSYKLYAVTSNLVLNCPDMCAGSSTGCMLLFYVLSELFSISENREFEATSECVRVDTEMVVE